MDKVLQTFISQIKDEFRVLLRDVLDDYKSLEKTESEEKLISAAEAAKLFQPPVSVQTIRSWARQGLLKVHYQGRLMFFKKSEILSASKTISKYKFKNQII
jgi:arsenate reductase-like glutaredoxin family protein